MPMDKSMMQRMKSMMPMDKSMMPMDKSMKSMDKSMMQRMKSMMKIWWKCDHIFVLINKITHIMPQSRIYTTDIPYTPCIRGNRSFDRMIVWFIFTYTISAISIPIWGLPIVLDITLRNNHLILGGGSNGFLFCFFVSFYIFRIWKKICLARRRTCTISFASDLLFVGG